MMLGSAAHVASEGYSEKPESGSKKEDGDSKKEKSDTKKEETSAKRARIIVRLPADAKFYVDGKQMKSTRALRSFHTPELEEDATYYYEVRAEVTRKGKPISEKRRLVVKAGKVYQADFTKLGKTSAATVSAR